MRRLVCDLQWRELSACSGLTTERSGSACRRGFINRQCARSRGCTETLWSRTRSFALRTGRAVQHLRHGDLADGVDVFRGDHRDRARAFEIDTLYAGAGNRHEALIRDVIFVLRGKYRRRAD